MEGTGSASSFVVAVMESAGYLAHSNVLEWFDVFWRFGGAFIYLISVVGAVVSVAIFGSYAWGRYLFIAPTLFWFLTNTTEDINFVTWKLGGSKPVAVNGALAQAMVERDDELRQQLSRVNPGQQTVAADGTVTLNKKARVSWFFSKTAKISDSIVNGIVDQILYNETNDDMLLSAKQTIMQFFLNAKPEDRETYQLFVETYLGSCLKYTEAMLRHADPRFSNLHELKVARQLSAIESKSGPMTEEDKTLSEIFRKRHGELVYERRALRREIKTLGEQKHKLSPLMQEFFMRMANRGAGKDVNPINPGIKYSTNNLGAQMLTCSDMSDVVAHQFIEEGKHKMSDAFTEAMNQSVEKGASLDDLRYSLCQRIALKIHPSRAEPDVLTQTHGGGKRECNLSQTIAIFMFKKVLEEQDISRNLQSVKKTLMFEPEAHKVFDAVALKDGTKVPVERGALSGQLTEVGSEFLRDEQGAIAVRDSSGKFRRFVVQRINSPFSIFYTEAQHFASREIQYDIFAGATKIPYYQGVLLYLVAVSFPFLALLVLVPGHAQAFLNVPLTWFWLKSWDIGYACIIVMDKILWNLLPSTEIEDKIFTGAADDPVNLGSVVPVAIQAAMATSDPTYDIHVNFNFTAMALYAVPAVTGYAILKTKKSILGSFVQGPRAAGKAAAPLSGSAFGLSIINRNIQRLGDQGVMATWAQGKPTGNGRFKRAFYSGDGGDAATKVGADGYSKAMGWVGDYVTGNISGEKGADGKYAKDPKSWNRLTDKAVSDLKDLYVGGSKTVRSLVGKQYMLDVAKGYSQDEDFGTTSYMAKQHRVIGGMVDGARRFELEEMDFAQSIVDAKYQLFMEKFWIVEDAKMAVATSSIKTLSKSVNRGRGGGLTEGSTFGAGAGVAGYSFYEALRTDNSNIDVYTDKGLGAEADKVLGTGGAWKPFSSGNR